MKIGVIITMFDENEIVTNSISNIKSNYPDSYIVVVQSDCGNIDMNISKNSDKHILLPNLGEVFNRFELPSQAITRNISAGIKQIYESNQNLDVIVIFTGDTLIIDATNILRRYKEMLTKGWIAMVSQSINSHFHANTDDPLNNISGNRHQNENTTDFACCYFLLDYREIKKTHAFSDIEITNKWTSEQCLGDELLKMLNGKDFKEFVGVLNSHNPTQAYSYNDGIKYHAKTNGIPSR